jgi:hypothetical protein
MPLMHKRYQQRSLLQTVKPSFICECSLGLLVLCPQNLTRYISKDLIPTSKL